MLRHAPAEHRDPGRWPNDDARPLRRSGRPEFARAARGLSTLLKSRCVAASSPLVRARQTAEILGTWYRPARSPELWKELRPESPASTALDRVARAIPPAGGAVLVVGHEPLLSRLIGLAVCGEGVPVIQCSKGGAIAVDFDAAVVPGGGEIAWALTRSQLGRLSGRKVREPSGAED
ncbi:MAG: histidine phosphatase family protein [Thermoplasmata archaeon]|nr:histidine phosphatase family protein [Thermoplasmata archaeon]